MAQIDDDILAAEVALAALLEQRHAQRGYYNKYKVYETDTKIRVQGAFVLLPERSAFDRAGMAAVADVLEAADRKPDLVAGIRDWIDRIENPPVDTGP